MDNSSGEFTRFENLFTDFSQLELFQKAIKKHSSLYENKKLICAEKQGI